MADLNREKPLDISYSPRVGYGLVDMAVESDGLFDFISPERNDIPVNLLQGKYIGKGELNASFGWQPKPSKQAPKPGRPAKSAFFLLSYRVLSPGQRIPLHRFSLFGWGNIHWPTYYLQRFGYNFGLGNPTGFFSVEIRRG